MILPGRVGCWIIHVSLYMIFTSSWICLTLLSTHFIYHLASIGLLAPCIPNTLATSCEELTHWKRLWCWEGLGAGGERDRGWDGWMASLTRWMWVWVNSGSWWWTGGPGMLLFMGLQRVGHDWATELNWIEVIIWCVKWYNIIWR